MKLLFVALLVLTQLYAAGQSDSTSKRYKLLYTALPFELQVQDSLKRELGWMSFNPNTLVISKRGNQNIIMQAIYIMYREMNEELALLRGMCDLVEGINGTLKVRDEQLFLYLYEKYLALKQVSGETVPVVK